MPNRLTDVTAEDDVSRSTEAILGSLFASEALALRSRLHVATKANPWAEWDQSLDAARVRLQLETSLAALRRHSVELFYLHAPDHNTPIRETLRTVDGACCRCLYRASSAIAACLCEFTHSDIAAQLCTERASCKSLA